ncbi:MAG: hypothetical protein JWN04_3337 [Myxococcaceae bacterium]|nr:hypothetical protein [Myxococcaceae bacterium]
MAIKYPTPRAGFALLALALVGSACVKENVEQKAREFQHIKKDLRQAKETVKSEVEEQAERAKVAAAKLQEKLPELKQNAREGLETAKTSLRESRDKVVDAVKSTLDGTHERIDQAVEQAQGADH